MRHACWATLDRKAYGGRKVRHKMFVKIMGCYVSETRDGLVISDASEERRSTMTEATTKLNAEDEMIAKKPRLSAPFRRQAERVTIALVTLAL